MLDFGPISAEAGLAWNIINIMTGINRIDLIERGIIPSMDSRLITYYGKKSGLSSKTGIYSEMGDSPILDTETFFLYYTNRIIPKVITYAPTTR
jgi:hypothetical protein